MLTPDELADNIVVVQMIAEAIRVAVAEERAACARVAREIAVGYMRGPQFEGYGRLAEVADQVNVAILARK